MQSVPNYQIIEFLDWLKYNQRNFDIKSDNLKRLAIDYLQDRGHHRDKFNLKFILSIFQICPRISEVEIIGEMEHFAQCGRCLHEIQRSERETFGFYSNVTLHPLLEQFLIFLEDKRFQRKLFSDERESIQTDIEFYDERFHFWIKQNGNELLSYFKQFIEKTDKTIINDFKRNRSSYKKIEQDRDSERDYNSELNVSSWGLENEAERLVFSTRYLLSDERNLQDQYLQHLYSTIFRDDFSKTLEFFNWLNERYPKLNLTSDIPSNKLSELIDRFCEDYSYSEISTFKKQVEKIFRGDIESNLLDKVRKWFRSNGKQIDYSKKPFDRYNQLNFHGIFLFPNFGSSDLIKFIDESWQDLNSLTGEWIDIYYSKEDIKKRNGFDILQDFKSFNNIKLTDLPSFIVWDSALKNALAIPLNDLTDNQILKTIQNIVQAIKDNKELKEVANAGMDFINKELDKKIPKQIQYIMGDNFEFSNAKNFTFVNKSNVENSFNKVKEQFDEETANVIRQIAEIVEKSSNSEAVELFDAFNEEVNKPEPKRSLLKSFWTGLTAVLPVLSSTAAIVEKVLKMIN